MISDSVSLSGSCTVHVSGTGPDVYPLTTLQSVSTLAAGGILDGATKRTTQNASELSKVVESLDKPLPARAEVRDIVLIVDATKATRVTSVMSLLQQTSPSHKMRKCECDRDKSLGSELELRSWLWLGFIKVPRTRTNYNRKDTLLHSVLASQGKHRSL